MRSCRVKTCWIRSCCGISSCSPRWDEDLSLPKGFSTKNINLANSFYLACLLKCYLVLIWLECLPEGSAYRLHSISDHFVLIIFWMRVPFPRDCLSYLDSRSHRVFRQNFRIYETLEMSETERRFHLFKTVYMIVILYERRKKLKMLFFQCI